jgi:serine O-acetyltransferase
MNPHFKQDLFRYYGEEKEPFLRRLFRSPELRYIALFRRCQAASNPLWKAVLMLRLKKMERKTHIQIPARTKIGGGFYIGHTGRVIIHPDARLGRNVNVGTGVTIGRENRGKREGAPTIGDNCWIGTNAVIVGNITIGEDVLIAPLAYVNFDVPAHSIVIGNPAKIIAGENATEGYIQNPV